MPENTGTPKPLRRRMVSTQLAVFTSDGQSITGRLAVSERQTINGKELGRYVLENEMATMIVNGTVQIDEAMRNVNVGEMVELVYLGSAVTSNGWTVKRFEVYVLEEDGTNG